MAGPTPCGVSMWKPIEDNVDANARSKTDPLSVPDRPVARGSADRGGCEDIALPIPDVLMAAVASSSNDAPFHVFVAWRVSECDASVGRGVEEWGGKND